MKRTFLVLLLSASCLHGEDSGGSSSGLTISEAVDLAASHNRRLQQGQLGVEAARDRAAQARSYYLPQVSANGLGARPLSPFDFKFAAGTFGSYPATGPIPSTNSIIRLNPDSFTMGAVTITQPLSQLVKISHKTGIADLAEQVEREKLRAAHQSIVRTVKQACFDLLRTRANLSAAAESKAFLVELNKTVSAGVANQTALRSEALAVEARLAEVELNQRQLRDLEIMQAEQVNALMGRSLELPVLLEPISGKFPEAGSLADARAHAFASRPEIRQARLQMEQTRLGVKAARADSLPDVSLVVSQQWLGNLDPVPRSIGYAGVALQWDLFNGGRKKSEVSIGQRVAQQAKLEVDETADRIAIEVGSAYRSLASSTLALEGADKDLELQREKLRISVESEAAGFAARSELLAQRAAYDASVSRRLSAYFDVWQAWANFQKSIGLD